MEEVQPIVNPNIPPENQIKPTKLWLKIVLFAVLGLILVNGLVFVGYQLGKRRTQPVSQLMPTPTAVTALTPTPTVVTQSTTLTPTLKPASTTIPDKTSNWKSYTNMEYMFLIKYPNDKQVEIDTTNPYIGLCNLNKAVVAFKIYPLSFQKPSIETEFSGDLIVAIDIEKNSDNLSIEEWVGRNCQESWLIGAQKETVNAAGLQAIKFTIVGESMSIPENQPMIIFKKNDLIYFIDSYGKREIFNLMLSTFKFLD